MEYEYETKSQSEKLRQIGRVENATYVFGSKSLDILRELYKEVRADLETSTKRLFQDLIELKIIPLHLKPIVRMKPESKEAKIVVLLLLEITGLCLDERQISTLIEEGFLVSCFELLLVLSIPDMTHHLRHLTEDETEEEARERLYTAILKIIDNVFMFSSSIERNELVCLLYKCKFYHFVETVYGAAENRYPATESLVMSILFYSIEDVSVEELFKGSNREQMQKIEPPSRHGRFGGTTKISEGNVFREQDATHIFYRWDGYSFTRSISEAGKGVNALSKDLPVPKQQKNVSRKRALDQQTEETIKKLAELFVERYFPLLCLSDPLSPPLDGSEKKFVRLRDFFLAFFLFSIEKGEKRLDLSDKKYSGCVLRAITRSSFESFLLFLTKNVEFLDCYERMFLVLSFLIKEHTKAAIMAKVIFDEQNVIEFLFRLEPKIKKNNKKLVEDYFNAQMTVFDLLCQLKKVGYEKGESYIKAVKENFSRAKFVNVCACLVYYWPENKDKTNERLGCFISYVLECSKPFLFFKLSTFLIFMDALVGCTNICLKREIENVFVCFFSLLKSIPMLSLEVFNTKKSEAHCGLLSEMVFTIKQSADGTEEDTFMESVKNDCVEPEDVEALEKKLKEITKQKDIFFE